MTTTQVSPNNPCPFLRALVELGVVSGHVEPLSHLSDVVTAAAGVEDAQVLKTKLTISLIALVANGLSPLQLFENARAGVTLDELRGGPLDKRGAGSRILRTDGQVDLAELDRLNDFAVDQTDSQGHSERGLGIDQITAMMDANFARAAGARRRIDRQLMNGEWPVLLRVLGKGAAGNPYLSVSELRALFVERRLPARILARLDRLAPAHSAAQASK